MLLSSLFLASSIYVDLTIPKSEKYWQLMNVIDTLQTYNSAALDSCYTERNFITREIIGRDPHPDSVLLIGVAWGVGHLFYTNWLENSNLKPRTKKILRILDFSSKGITIGGNHYNGVRIMGKNRPRDGRTDCIRKKGGMF